MVYIRVPRIYLWCVEADRSEVGKCSESRSPERCFVKVEGEKNAGVDEIKQMIEIIQKKTGRGVKPNPS